MELIIVKNVLANLSFLVSVAFLSSFVNDLFLHGIT